MMAIIYRFVNSWPDSLESDLNLEITTPHVHALHDWGFVFMIIAQLLFVEKVKTNHKSYDWS